jgi:hypothetical protein
MLQSLNPVFALQSWSIKQVKGRYYIALTAQEGKHRWHAKGYTTLARACNAIARKLEAEWTSRARRYQEVRR